MKKRSGSGSASNDDVLVRPPGVHDKHPPPKHTTRVKDEERAKELHARAMADVKRSRRHRNETIRAAIFGFLKSVVPKILVLGGLFVALMYDAVQHHGTLRGYAEEFVAVFGLIFSLLVWAWSRR